MANLPETPQFDEGIYQIETVDPVVGGPNGVSNEPARGLANRTRYLKNEVDALKTQKAPLASPNFSGNPTAPTPSIGADSSTLANTAWVNQRVRTLAAPIAHVGAGGAAHAAATSSTAGFMSASDKQKLDGIASGAQANTVTSVAGRTGAVTLSVADIANAASEAWARANTVESINGKRGTIGRLTVSDIEGVAALAGAVFSGVVEFKYDAKGKTWQTTDDSPSFATTAWVRSAMADIATRAGLLYSYRAEPSGYIRLPTFLGGFTIQWMKHNAVNNIARVNFPLAFANACMTAVVSPDNGSGRVYSAGTLDRTGCTINRHTEGSGGNDPLSFWCRIIAVGH